MKIALIGNDYKPQFPLVGYGGVEICVENLAIGLNNNDNDFFVVTPNHHNDTLLNNLIHKKNYGKNYPFEIIYTKSAASAISKKNWLPFILETKEILKAKKPDIIWSQSNWSAEYLKDLNIPIICTFQDSCLKQPNWILKDPHLFYRFVSKFQFNNWAIEPWEIHKSFQLYTGLLDEEFCLKENYEKDYFLWVGGFNWDLKQKGLDVFIELAKMNPNKQFVCYGKGNKKLEAFIISESKKIANLDYRGELLRGAQHKEAFMNAKAFIMPTRIPETFARVNLEALSKGTPIIGFPNGCMVELVNQENGFLSEDIQQLSESLNYVYNHSLIYENSQKFHVNEEIKNMIKQSESIIQFGKLASN